VPGSRGFRLQIARIARRVAAQAAVDARAQNLRIEDLSDYGERVVDQHQ